ncbi:MAG: DUF3592 domain-containing protein [Anaerolineales bacterium]|nr:DUF3592 domain-containing protein [Anaerolineales bacterium]
MTIQIRRKRQINNPFIGGLFMIVIGLGLTLILANTVLKDGRASQDWPTTTGTVTTSELHTQRSGDGYSYSPRIVYEYVVNDETLVSSRVTVADGSSSRPDGAQETVDRYPVGAEVTVYYDTAVPTQSLLEAGTPTVVTWLYRAGWAFAVIGGLVLVRSVLRLLFGFLRRGL